MMTQTFTAGLLIRGQVRDYLASEKFRGRRIDWHESKGWLDSIFTIRGEESDVRTVVATLAHHYAD